MKKYLYLFIVTIGLSSCSQNLTCEDFKDGEFKIPSSMKKNRVINVIRKGNSQVEIVDGQPTLYYVIKWTGLPSKFGTIFLSYFFNKSSQFHFHF
jgi:hypothetical protein